VSRSTEYPVEASLGRETRSPDAKTANTRRPFAFPLQHPPPYATIPIMLPRGCDRRTTVFLTFALLFVISTKLAPAQVFDVDRDRVPMVELNGLMRFHTGDDPHWSDPDFDDSQWALLRPDQGWSQAYPGYTGFAWYRFAIVPSRNRRNLALYIPYISSCYQVFLNGRLIGGQGGLPPHQLLVDEQPRVFNFTTLDRDSKGPLVIAIRVWQWKRSVGFDCCGFRSAPIVGDAPWIASWQSKNQKENFWSHTGLTIEFFIQIVAAIASFILFALRRTEREFLWFGILELMDFSSSYVWLCRSNYSLPLKPMEIFADAASIGFELVLVFLLYKLLSLKREKLFWLALACMVARSVLILPCELEWISYPAWHVFDWIFESAYWVALLIPLFFSARARNRDARLILLPILLMVITEQLLEIAFLGNSAGMTSATQFLDRLSNLTRWPFPVADYDLSELFFQGTLISVLIARFARSRRSEERMTSELEAARTVQQVLIPEEIPAIPGLTLDCVYKPAGQVGGDFFQILPTPNNGALIVIGDVSGKGIPAAMAVSLLVGTVRTLAHYTQSPAEILTAMNLRMLGRSKDGFTTCLVLRLDQDGTATVSNAGHLAPYIGSNELPVESGLPLGLAAQADYTETTFHLYPGAELTLVTDGVAEARAKTGELFGFERTASISTLSAQHIAATAVAFGQQDDITVLKIRRHPVPVGVQVLAGA
jgi:hypothetical protein